jgi:hypothetical protein
MESKQFRSLMEVAMQVALNEDHRKGEEVIVFGMKGVVVKEVGSDGDTENDEVYRVKFEDGTIKNVPARDMEMQSDESDKRKPSENEAEDIVNENVGRMNPTIAKHVGRTIGSNTKEFVEEKKKSFRDIPDAAELIRKFDMEGEGIDIPATNNKKWGTPGFTTEDFKRGDSVVGRRGNHAGIEYVVHSNHPDENHMTVRVPRKTDGKIKLVQVSPSNFGRPKPKYRKFPGPVPRPRQK